MLLFASFVAGILTIAAPCILPLLPVVIGGTSTDDNDKKVFLGIPRRPLIIIASLSLSVIVFSLVLRASTMLLGVPDAVWQTISGGIIVFLGVAFLWPQLWDRFTAAIGLHTSSNKLLGSTMRRQDKTKDILTGAALGPVFLSCSPTYLLIVGAILPTSFLEGFIYLIAYTIGLALALLAITLAGQRAVKKLGWLSNPSGWFYRSVGVIFIIVGVMIIAGWDRDFQAYVLEQGWYQPIESIENRLR